MKENQLQEQEKNGELQARHRGLIDVVLYAGDRDLVREFAYGCETG